MSFRKYSEFFQCVDQCAYLFVVILKHITTFRGTAAGIVLGMVGLRDPVENYIRFQLTEDIFVQNILRPVY